MIESVPADKTSGGGRRSLWKGPALVTALVLTPLLMGAYFVKDWHWHRGAFVVVGAVVFCLGLVYETITWKRDSFAYRAAVGIAFVTGFALMWGNFVQMADVNPANAMFFAVPIVGIIGAIVARLRPMGMSRALFVTALAQALVLTAVLVLWSNRNSQVGSWTASEWRGFAGNAVNAMLFVGSALLFRKAGRGESSAETA